MHLIQDDVLPASQHLELLSEAKKFHAEFPNLATVYNNLQENKIAYDAKYLLGPLAKYQRYLTDMGQHYLETLLGKTIHIDPAGRGCGLHILPPNGFLDLHFDGNWHPELCKLRIASLVYYLDGPYDSPFFINEDHVEFKPNRLVLFSTPDALHGVPTPVSTWRYTLSSFYYIDGPMPAKVHRAFFPHADPTTRAQRAAL